MVVEFVDVGFEFLLEGFEEDDFAFLGDFFDVGFGLGWGVGDEEGYFGLVIAF